MAVAAVVVLGAVASANPGFLSPLNDSFSFQSLCKIASSQFQGIN